MVSQLVRMALATLLLVGLAGSAQALQFAEVALNDCNSMGCEGSTLYLSVEEEAGGTWLVTYTINTENYTGGLAGFNQIGFKVVQDWTTGEVLSSPIGSMTNPDPYGALVPWNPVFEAPINSNSLCDNTTGNTSKVCVAGFVGITDYAANGNSWDYTWTFRLDGGTLMDPDEWHLGAQYANGRYRSQGHIISAGGGAPIPEPTAAMLFGMGVVLVTRSARRR